METLNKIIELYNHSTPISELTCQTTDYQVFKHNNLIRFCDIKSLIKYAPVGSDKRIDAFSGFSYENPYFWMIPLTTTSSSEIFGFVLKSYHQKAYRNVFCQEHKCSFFGFHNFHNFKYGYPIILVEGTKDQLIVNKFYPYTLATLTCGLGQDDLKAVRKLTNKIILCYDNDKSDNDAGPKATRRDMESLIKSGCKVAKAFYTGKDPGDLYNNLVAQNILKHSIKSILQNF